MAGPAAQRDFRHVPSHEAATCADDLDWILDRLRAVGIAGVVTLDLTRPEMGVPVVRVVIPGLEGPDDHDPTYLGHAPAGSSGTAMKACVFVGPTLRRQDLPADDDIVALPPVAQGDVYRVAPGRGRSGSSMGISKARRGLAQGDFVGYGRGHPIAVHIREQVGRELAAGSIGRSAATDQVLAHRVDRRTDCS